MALQGIKGPTFGSTFGKRSAASLSSGLQALAREKMTQLTRRQKGKEVVKRLEAPQPSLRTLRKKFMIQLKSRKITPQQGLTQLQGLGLNPSAINAIISPKLTDNVVKYFLSMTNNNPKKARAIAKKVGYKF